MTKRLGIIGQDIFDMFCEEAEASKIEERLYRYLPDEFGKPGGFFQENERTGGSRFVEIDLWTCNLESLPESCGVSVPDWADRVAVYMSMILRFKPQRENRAAMLCSIEVHVSAESATIPPRNEKLSQAKFRDIDKAVEEAEKYLR